MNQLVLGECLAACANFEECYDPTCLMRNSVWLQDSWTLTSATILTTVLRNLGKQSRMCSIRVFAIQVHGLCKLMPGSTWFQHVCIVYSRAD